MTGTDWWNPTTLQAIVGGVVGFLTLLTLIVIYFNMRNAKDEAEKRTRPWLSVIGFVYETDGSVDHDLVKVLYRNVGVLPAEDVRLSVSLDTGGDRISWPDEEIVTIFPQEPGDRRVGGQELDIWRKHGLVVSMRGEFSYSSGRRKYFTQFEATIREGEIPAWRNTRTN